MFSHNLNGNQRKNYYVACFVFIAACHRGWCAGENENEDKKVLNCVANKNSSLFHNFVCSSHFRALSVYPVNTC